MADDGVFGFVRRLADPAGYAGATDRELLGRFAGGDEAAFEALVGRYARLVRSAAARVLPAPADVDDATQATFLVLARRAAREDWRSGLGAWLRGVAHRVAVRLRARGRRSPGPLGDADPADPAPPPDLGWREACDLLHAELDRLPDRYRLPLLLCYLEGRTRDEAAAALGVTVGTVKGRVRRGCELLRRRLARRGVSLSVGLLAVAAAPRPAAACPPALIAAVRGVPPPRVSELVLEVSRAMAPKTNKLAVLATVAAVLVAAAGLVAVARPDPAPRPAPAAPAPKAEPREGVIVVTQPDIRKTAEVLDPEGKPAGRFNLGRTRTAYAPRLSPDGRRVALLTYINPEVGTSTSWPSYALMVFDLDAREPQDNVLVDRVRCPSFAWSPDGKKLYVSSIPREKLRVADNVDQVVPVLTRVYDLAGGTDAATDIPEGHGVSDVAPDGGSVLTTVLVKDPDFERLTNYVVPLDTFKPVPLAKEGYFAPRFSPDGSRVLGVRRLLSKSPAQGVFVFDLATKQETRLALPKKIEGAPIEQVCWSPDGKRVLLQWEDRSGPPLPPEVGRGGGLGGLGGGGVFPTRLSVVHVDGAGMKPLAEYTKGEWISGIDWR